MIEVYTGFVGSGKSYHVIRRGTQIADAPLGNRWVVANFPIRDKKKFLARLPLLGRLVKNKYVKPRWIHLQDEELTPEMMIQIAREKEWGVFGSEQEGECLLIIDEAATIFNSRDWNVKPDVRRNWIKFFTQCRKFGYDVVFITQDVRMLDRQIRSLFEYEVQHKKMNSFSVFKFLPFTLFAAVKFWNGGRLFKGSAELMIYNKRIAERYDTMKIFNWHDFGGEEALGGEGKGVPASAGGSLPSPPVAHSSPDAEKGEGLPSGGGEENYGPSGNVGAYFRSVRCTIDRLVCRVRGKSYEAKD